MSRKVLLMCAVAVGVLALGVPPVAAATAPGTSDAARVEELQRDLNVLGCNSGTIDGALGPNTVQAVRWFQTAAGLAVDGIVGPATTAALTQAAATGQPTCTGVPAPAPLPAPAPGTAGAACAVDPIKAGAQKGLLANETILRSGPYQCAGGYAYNAPTVQVPGGKATTVIELLKWNGTSWQPVDRSIYCESGSVPQALYARTCLQRGTDPATNRGTSDGAQVEQIQRQLNALGCNAGKIDGKLGPNTVSAIRWFQTAARVGVDGIVGPQTSAALTRAAASGTPNCTQVPRPTPAPTTTSTGVNGIPCTQAVFQSVAQASLRPGETIVKTGPFQCSGPWAYNGPTISSGGTSSPIALLMRWNGSAWQIVDRNAYCESGGIPAVVAKKACQVPN